MATKHDVDAAELVRRKEYIYALNRDNAEAAEAGELTGEMLAQVLELGDELDAMCEAFRRSYYPRRARVATAQGRVFTISATGRSIETVWESYR